MTTATPRDPSELMFLGRECHHPSCHLNDFLPFSCPACHLSFCQPHFLPSQHSCKSPLPLSMVDRIAPQCPLCNQIVPTTTSRDPNEAVDMHILDGICVGLPGGEEKRKAELRGKKERGEVCWRRGCSKSLIVPMRCQSCQHAFCPPHRSAASHQCTPNTSRTNTPQPGPSSSSYAPKRTAAGSAGAKAAMSRFLPGSSKPSPQSTPPTRVNPAPVATYSSSPPVAPSQASTPLDVRAAAAAAAMKRAGKDVKANVPFVKTKTEKRANSELSSQIQALKNRHDKGLLSKAEELRYAELVGEREAGKRKGEGEKGKDGCVVC